MLKPSHLIAASLLIVWSPLRGADATPAGLAATASDMLPVPATGEADDLARLHALPANHIPLKGATLASAIRLLAQTARMSYIAPSDAEFSERVTSDVMMNPFDLLQVLGDSYGFGMEYGRGVWRFYRVNLNEMVSKAYSIRFNNLQQVTIQSSSINSQLAAAGASSGGMGGMGGSAGMGGGLAGGSSSSALGGRGTFSSKPDKIIEDIKKILSLPTVGLATPSLEGSSIVPGAGADRKAQEAPKVEPIWNPETSQLFVVATRQQHSLIASYLKAVDRPQKLVRIAVKFVETSRNPQQALGVDWSQTFLGSGGPVTLAGNNLQSSTSTTSVFSTVPSAAANNGSTTTTLTSSGVTNGTVSSSTTNSSGSSGVTGASSSGTTVSGTANALATSIGLGHYFPTTLLSAPAFQWTVQAIATDKYSSIVQDPVIYTTNNREVSFADTTQQPVQQGTTTIGSSTAATTSSIAYIDVGTQLTVLPCILPGGGPNRELVQLNLSINVSSIVGTQVIGGNPYPITSSRTYSYSVSVPAGQTLAIAGLEDRERQTNDSKVPDLRRHPAHRVRLQEQDGQHRAHDAARLHHPGTGRDRRNGRRGGGRTASGPASPDIPGLADGVAERDGPEPRRTALRHFGARKMRERRQQGRRPQQARADRNRARADGRPSRGAAPVGPPRRLGGAARGPRPRAARCGANGRVGAARRLGEWRSARPAFVPPGAERRRAPPKPGCLAARRCGLAVSPISA